MARSKTSKRWLKEHFTDPFVQRAKQQGYRARSAFKLLQLQEKHRLFKPGDRVVDLGAAPGGWSQVLSNLVGEKGKVWALDVLAMDELPGVCSLQGDFREPGVLTLLAEKLQGQGVQAVLSDMAPNFCGDRETDQLRSVYLAEIALEFALAHLKPEGIFLVKLFHGVGYQEFVKTLRQYFSKVQMVKPEASRKRSAEIYALAMGFRKALTGNSSRAP